jgi:hypothetical protein
MKRGHGRQQACMPDSIQKEYPQPPVKYNKQVKYRTLEAWSTYNTHEYAMVVLSQKVLSLRELPLHWPDVMFPRLVALVTWPVVESSSALY